MSLWKDSTLWPPGYHDGARCYAAPPGFLYPLERYGPRLRALRGQRIFVAAVGDDDQPDFIDYQRQQVPKVAITNVGCSPMRYCASPRLAAFIAQINARAHPRLRGLYIDIPCPGDQKIAEQVAQTAVDYGDL